MGIEIDDGRGRGLSASVSEDNRLNVSSKAAPRPFYVSRVIGPKGGNVNVIKNSQSKLSDLSFHFIPFQWIGNNVAFIVVESICQREILLPISGNT